MRRQVARHAGIFHTIVVLFGALASSGVRAAAEGPQGAPSAQGKALDQRIEQLQAEALARPNDAAMHAQLGSALAGRGRFQEAATSFEKAISLDPNNAASRTGFAYALIELKRYDDAVVQARQALRIDPDGMHGYVELGTALGEKGELNEAAAAFSEAARVAPSSSLPPKNLGAVYMRMNRWGDAIEQLVLARTIDPWVRGVEEMLRAVAIKGRSDLERAAGAVPPQARPHYQLAYVRMFVDGPRKALEEVDRAISIDGSKAEFFEARAFVLGQDGRSKDAEAAARRCAELDLTSWRCQFQRGVALASLNAWEDAEKAFTAADALVRPVKSVQGGLCAVQLQLQPPSKAVESCEKALATPTVNPADHFNLSLAYKRTGDKQKAIWHARLAERGGLPQARGLLEDLGGR